MSWKRLLPAYYLGLYASTVSYNLVTYLSHRFGIDTFMRYGIGHLQRRWYASYDGSQQGEMSEWSKELDSSASLLSH